MKESNAAIVQENNMFENHDPKEFQFLTILAFLPFSRFLISYFMKQSDSITLSQCKKIVGIYTGITVLLFTIIFFVAKAFVPSFDILKTQIDQSIQITVGDSQSLVPDSVEKNRRYYNYGSEGCNSRRKGESKSRSAWRSGYNLSNRRT